MGIRVFTSSRFRNADYSAEVDLKKLQNDFKTYKETGNPSAIFGRDAPYHRPQTVVSAEVQHLHVNLKGNWNLRIVQRRRVSDAALIYCQGWHSKDNYLLLALLEDQAHRSADDTLYLLALAEIAEDFRSKY